VVVQGAHTLVHPKISYSTAEYPQGELSVDEILAAENRTAFALNSAA
jgi:hypothetical protein